MSLGLLKSVLWESVSLLAEAINKFNNAQSKLPTKP